MGVISVVGRDWLLETGSHKYEYPTPTVHWCWLPDITKRDHCSTMCQEFNNGPFAKVKDLVFLWVLGVSSDCTTRLSNKLLHVSLLESALS
jgi:hypothetical protein